MYNIDVIATYIMGWHSVESAIRDVEDYNYVVSLWADETTKTVYSKEWNPLQSWNHFGQLLTRLSELKFYYMLTSQDNLCTCMLRTNPVTHIYYRASHHDPRFALVNALTRLLVGNDYKEEPEIAIGPYTNEEEVECHDYEDS